MGPPVPAQPPRRSCASRARRGSTAQIMRGLFWAAQCQRRRPAHGGVEWSGLTVRPGHRALSALLHPLLVVVWSPVRLVLVAAALPSSLGVNS